MTIQCLMPALSYLGFRAFNDLTPKNGIALLECLGRFEMVFDQDIAADLRDGLKPGSLQMFLSQTTFYVIMITSCNLPEIYLLWKCVQATKSQTQAVTKLLSLSALEKRKK